MIDLFISILGPLFIVSYLMIMIQFKRWQKHTLTEMRHNPLWPSMIFEYKKYTLEKTGKVGSLFYLTLASGLCLITLLFIELISWVLSTI
jgi:hypothetical protein